ncbi:MAG: HAMP domain-containing histidine kinase [Clostridiales bacterium]|nr:HAMP domain-containing histidine kinase [Clostridiales bacterium]
MAKSVKTHIGSIRYKLIFAYLAVIIVAFLLLGASMTAMMGDYMYKYSADLALEQINGISAGVDFALSDFDTAKAYELASRCSSRIIIADPDGVVVCDTSSLVNGCTLEPPFDISKKASALLKAGSVSSFSPESDSYVVLSAVKLDNGFIYSLSDADGIIQNLKSLCIRLCIALAGILLLSVLLGLLFTRSFTRPVKELDKAIKSLSQGDFTVRAKEIGNTELTRLASAFNDMAGRMEMLDRSRNSFVSNASHELKTPLATMKIMVQTLLYQDVPDPAMNKEFLGDVDKEIDRLNAIVVDLLTLVGMDSGETPIKKEELSLSKMLEEDVKRLSPLARERGIQLDISIRDDLYVSGDEIKLDQVFYNLLDNALKYTPRGKNVLVEVYRSGRQAIVKVKDEGIGIPEDKIPHIFDRFYRVDKARGRETGGTGLGLSIAKQILLAHGGNINVTSVLDKGSVFTVELPLLSGRASGKEAEK